MGKIDSDSFGYAFRVGNSRPITPAELSEQTGMPIDDVMEFLELEFGGYEKYVSACKNGEQLGIALARLNNDP